MGVGEDFKDNRARQTLRRGESLDEFKIFFLVRRGEILEAQIAGVVLNQVAGLLAVVPGGGDEFVGVVAKLRGVIVIHAEFGTAPVVDKQEAQIAAEVSAAREVHIVEKGEVADNAEEQLIGRGK